MFMKHGVWALYIGLLWPSFSIGQTTRSAGTVAVGHGSPASHESQREEWRERQNAFLASLRSQQLAPEDRIAVIDEYTKTLDTKSVAPERSVQHLTPSAEYQNRFGSREPVTELEKIDASIAKEFEAAQSRHLAPNERIRQIDAAIKKTAPLEEQRADLQRDGTLRGAAPPQETATRSQENTGTPEGRLAEKSSQVLEQVKNLTPRERIAVIDAAQLELRKLQDEVLQAQATKKPHIGSPSPDNQTKR